jgi:hypothetical protein
VLTEEHLTIVYIGFIVKVHTFVTILLVETAIADFVPDALLYVKITRKINVQSY